MLWLENFDFDQICLCQLSALATAQPVHFESTDNFKDVPASNRHDYIAQTDQDTIHKCSDRYILEQSSHINPFYNLVSLDTLFELFVERSVFVLLQQFAAAECSYLKLTLSSVGVLLNFHIHHAHQ